MLLTWHGATCIHLQSGDATVILDPLDRRLKADAYVFTNEKRPGFSAFKNSDAFTVTHPGEYEVGGISVHGTAMNGETVYTLAAEGIVVGHLGAINRPPTGTEIETLLDIDILCIAVGKEGLSPRHATEVVSAVEPRIILPLGDGAAAFCKEMGAKNIDAQPKLRIVKKDLPTDDVRVIVLQKA